MKPTSFMQQQSSLHNQRRSECQNEEMTTTHANLPLSLRNKVHLEMFLYFHPTLWLHSVYLLQIMCAICGFTLVVFCQICLSNHYFAVYGPTKVYHKKERPNVLCFSLPQTHRNMNMNQLFL